jgi:CBS domain-containing protein
MTSAAEALAANTITALRSHAPFDEMDGESLRLVAERAALAYYPRSVVISGPEGGPAERLYIIKQGQVRARGLYSQDPAADLVYGTGECFPIGALVGNRAPVYEFRAEGDVFCWELPAVHFHTLLSRSAPFRAFCTDHLATLVERANRAQRMQATATLSDDAGMLAPLRSVLARPPVSCPPDAPVRQVLMTMRTEHIGSMVIVDGDRVPIGILTTVDVLERIAAPQANVDAPVSSLMTPMPATLEEDATLADAAILMARRGIRHIVVTRDGRLCGVVSERDLFAVQRVSLRRTAERIQVAASAAELAAAATDIRAFANHLLAHGIGAEQLTAMVSALNDALSHRMIEVIARTHAIGDRWCWMALGSEGRMEQTFVTDQDNALIFAEGEKDRLLAFADEVNRGLDAAGFPLCKGDIMARNPRWCLTAEEWRDVFERWIRSPQPEALLNASIFFDLRSVAGEVRLVGELRETVLGEAKANRGFLRAMAENALLSGPPIGLLKSFSSDELDLKGAGARPFVDAARVLALAAGIAETGTARRLRATGESRAAEAFHFIQGVRLRNGNRVNVDALSDLERRALKEAFRQGSLLQERLRMDFGL